MSEPPPPLWPTFRYDRCNSGRSPLRAAYHNDRPWSFQTAKGIFSTPVIDGQGTVYFGSADHCFYALGPGGSLEWKFETGEVIDSAAALSAPDPYTGEATVTFISGDGCMYHCRTAAALTREERLLWTFAAEERPGASFNRWFEGNVAAGPDGTLYAGNTNFNYYAVHPDGTLKWTYTTGSNNWSQAAFGADGTLYWGSCDTFIRAVSPHGRELWRKRTLGFIAASAAVGSDGTVYIGSFDSNFYALEPRTGKVLWKFTTGDHIYSSAALGVDAHGQTQAIYFGSADGRLYALRPDGARLWTYSTGAPVRSSPVVGLGPEGEAIIYFGCGDGKLYALQASGELRWAFDTTPDDPELADRNDLNGSPALGATGVYIGGEHGCLWYVPYDYPLHHPADRRGQAAEDCSAGDSAGLVYVSPGGNLQEAFPEHLPAAVQIALRLAVRRNGQAAGARLWTNPLYRPPGHLRVRLDPPAPFQAELSADGRTLYIRPDGFLTPGQRYSLSVQGKYYTSGLRLGNLALQLIPQPAGRFASRFSFTVQEPALPRLPLELTPGQTGALEWTRLAAPLPSMLPSLNQIGFDYMDWIIGLVAVTLPDAMNQGRWLAWAIGARRAAGGMLAADPGSDITLPLSGRYQGNDFILQNRRFRLPITGIHIPFNRFELRGRLEAGGSTRHAAAYADTRVLAIPKFGPYLVIAGLASHWIQKLLVFGTFITRPYPAGGPANRRPPGVALAGLAYRPPARAAPGYVEARLRLEPGAAYPAAEHRAGILLADPAACTAVPLDYHANLATQVDEAGNIRSVKLALPPRTRLPGKLRAYVLLDVFPFYWEDLDRGQDFSPGGTQK